MPASCPAIPRATYRLQFHSGFSFADAMAIVPYLAELGISHIYASPYLKARPGSQHGYDIIDHNTINPEVGDSESFAAFCGALAAHGMGQILDFVPNHVGIFGAENKWFLDVLTWGEDSQYAEYFDFDWRPAKPELHGKLLVPLLGDAYGAILTSGEGGIVLRYRETAFDRRAIGGEEAPGRRRSPPGNRRALKGGTFAARCRRSGLSLPHIARTRRLRRKRRISQKC